MKDEKQNQLSTKATAFSIDAIIGNQSPHLAHGMSIHIVKLRAIKKLNIIY